MTAATFHPAFETRVKNDPFLTETLLTALDSEAPVSVRRHSYKRSPEFQGAKPVTWCTNAFYLEERPSFTLDPLFHAGTYYPQEAGSMLLDHVLRQLSLPEKPKVLDLCAAPGGKSTLIASFLENKGLLVANEVIGLRSRILKENLSKWGYSNCIVTNNDPSDFVRLTGYFDVMAVDAPCSGEGMFRKDPAARAEWSPDNVQLCAARQKRILHDSWSCLKEGGYLIYSTCTFNKEENEENARLVEQEFGAERVELSMPDTITPGRDGVGYYGIPGVSETEGFFISVFRKITPESTTKPDKKNRNTGLKQQKDLLDLSTYAHTEEQTVLNWNEYLFAVPETMEQDYQWIQSQLRIVKFGTELGSVARKGIIPSPELALNFSLRKAEKTTDLSKEEALHYLHGDTFSLSAPQGFQLVAYEKEPLGWIKHLGNRFNNLYPKEWRIKMEINEK